MPSPYRITLSAMQRLAWLAAVVLSTTTVAYAQFGRGGFFGFGAGHIAQAQDFDGRFHYCRIVYRQSPDGRDGSWRTDYPRADINFSIRLSELTRTNVSFSDAEGLNLRTYLLKGGFLWVDDFWGSYEWDHWVREIRHALPADEYPIIDVPPNHPLLRTQYEVTGVTQIPNIGFYMRSGGRTSEQGADSAVPHLRAIADRTGRIMVLITHNTDLGDSWEREGDDPGYFMAFGPKGYALGINAFLYALTH
jgi:hypothetical protein